MESFIDYTNKMLELHRLIAADEDEDDVAEMLREDLGDLADRMHPTPRTMAQNLSGDLYMLSEKDMYVKTDDEEKKVLREELHESLKSQRWVRVLEILRHNLGLPRGYIALVRGRVWLEFNPNAARAFIDYAIQQW